MQVDTHCKIGRIFWKRHSTATRLPNKARKTFERLTAELDALAESKRREAIERAAVVELRK